MNKQQKLAKERAEIMLAYANGAEICCKRREFSTDTAGVTSTPLWNWDEYEYFIKPVEKKKVKMWQWIYREQNGRVLTTMYFYKCELDVLLNSGVLIGPALWTEIGVEE